MIKTLVHCFWLTWVVILVQACSGDPKSPEEQIRQFLKSGVEAAENRSADTLKDMMDDNYLDHKGYNKNQLGKLLRVYFFKHKNIHLFTKIDEIELLAENEAIVSLHVAMAGSVISDVDALSALKARIYRFELQLIRQDEWLLRHAVWGPASISVFG